MVIFVVIFFVNTPTSYLESAFYPYIFDKIDVWTSLYDRQSILFDNYALLAQDKGIKELFSSAKSLRGANSLMKSLAITTNIDSTELIELSDYRENYSPVSQRSELYFYSSGDLSVPYVNNENPSRVNLIYPVSQNNTAKSLLGVISITIDSRRYVFSHFERVFRVSDGGAILQGKTPYPLSKNDWDEELWIELEKASSNKTSGFLKYQDEIILFGTVHTVIPNKKAFLIYFINSTETFLYYLPQIITIVFWVILISTYVYYEFYKRSRQLEDRANIDELSNLYNRAYYNQVKSKFVNGNYYLGIVDIDFFKNVNDTYGHDIGDMVIKAVAMSIKVGIRDRDYAFRVGGEEFVIVFDAESYEHAAIGFERVRESIYESYSKPHVTASLGFTRIKHSADKAFKVADQQLYIAKEKGRNQSSGVV